MDKADLTAQLLAHLQASAREARQAMEEAVVEARDGATPNEKREDSRVALEQAGLARAHKERLGRALAELGALEGFNPPKRTARVTPGAIVEVESDDVGRTFFIAPAGAGIELTGPGGDGYLTVVTPTSPVGKAVMGCEPGDTVEIRAGGDVREWTVSFVE